MNDVNKRFSIFYNFLLSEKKVKNASDFARIIEISPSMLTEIAKGRSNIGMTVIQNSVEKFGLNADWLLTGDAEMLKIKPSVNILPEALLLNEPIGIYSLERDILDTISIYLERINSYTKEIETLINIERLQKQNSDTKSDKSRTKSGEK